MQKGREVNVTVIHVPDTAAQAAAEITSSALRVRRSLTRTASKSHKYYIGLIVPHLISFLILMIKRAMHGLLPQALFEDPRKGCEILRAVQF